MNEQLQAKVQKLLAEGQDGLTIQTALATKYSTDVANSVMANAFKDKIKTFRASGASDADILKAFHAKGYTFTSLGGTSPIATQTPPIVTQTPPIATQLPEPATPSPVGTTTPVGSKPVDQLSPPAAVTPNTADASTLPQVAGLPGDPSSDFATPAPGTDGANTASAEQAPIIANGRDAASAVAEMRNIQHRYMYPTHLASLVSPEARQRLSKLKAETTDITKSELTRLGFKVTDISEDGIVSVQDPVSGEVHQYGGASLDTFLASAYEVAGSAMGAYAGQLVGGAVGMAAGPVGAVTARVAGGIAGAYLGSQLGRASDLARHAMSLNYSLSTAEVLGAMSDAGMADIMLNSLGVVAGPAISGAWRYGQGGGRALKTIYNAVRQKNTGGAIKAAMDNFNLNHTQAIQLISDMEVKYSEKLLSDKAKATGVLQNEDAMAVAHMAIGQPGSAKFVRTAASESKTGGSKQLSELRNRAADVKREVDSLANPQILAEMKDKLGISEKSALPATDGYIVKTKEIFGETKQLGIDSMQDIPFKFDYAEATLIPELKKMASKIHFNVRPEFYDYIRKVEELGGVVKKAKVAKPKPTGLLGANGKPVTVEVAKAKEASNGNRTFADLLELRKVVNEMSSDAKFNTHFQGAQARTTLQGVDSLISKTALEQMPGGAIWLKQWKKANQEYSNMLTFKQNNIYKILTNTKVTPDTGVALIAKSMMADDSSSFMAAMAKLPKQTRQNVEGSVLKHFTDQATVSHHGGIEVMDFVKLDQSLAKVNFTQTEARNTARAVKQIAETVKNDSDLAMHLGSVPLSTPSQTFATTGLGLAKRVLINWAYHRVLARVPFSNEAGKAALTNHISAVLDNPLSLRAVKDLKSSLPADPALDTAIHKLGIEFAQRGAKEHYGQVRLHRAHHAGKFNTASDTMLGRGMLYYADESTAKSIAKATNARVTEAFILRKRIATPEDAARIVGYPLSEADYRDPLVQHVLQKNYAGIAKDGLVLLFKQPK